MGYNYGMEQFDAILCRTNAGCVSAAMEVGSAGHTFALLISGGLWGLRNFASGAQDLKNGVRTDFPELAAFSSWEEVQSHVETDEGEDLKPMVRLVDKYGTEAIFEVCSNSISEKNASDADTQIVTVHRSKGMEWDRVKIFSDFTPPKQSTAIPLDDLRLAYVAVTRARLYLDALSLDWMFNGEYEAPNV